MADWPKQPVISNSSSSSWAASLSRQWRLISLAEAYFGLGLTHTCSHCCCQLLLSVAATVGNIVACLLLPVGCCCAKCNSIMCCMLLPWLPLPVACCYCCCLLLLLLLHVALGMLYDEAYSLRGLAQSITGWGSDAHVAHLYKVSRQFSCLGDLRQCGHLVCKFSVNICEGRTNRLHS